MNDVNEVNLVDEIKQLKTEKNAVILVHNYQRPEIYEIADFIGDSLGLCKEAANTNADIIVFCGVSFMAESAAVLNSDKKVIVPFEDAGCAMADMVDIEGLKKLQKKHPQAVTVTYVNSTAEVKAMSDICCTSSNAVKVVRSVDAEEVIFLPDRNLANYVQRKVPEKKIIPWDGYCPMHNAVDPQYVEELKSEYPKAKLLVHPESRPEVIDKADYVASTSGMIECAKKSNAKEFFVLTECGMTDRLHREVPGKKFHGLCNVCFDMKKNTLHSILTCLKNEKPVVRVDKKIAKRALLAFERMFEVS